MFKYEPLKNTNFSTFYSSVPCHGRERGQRERREEREREEREKERKKEEWAAGYSTI
jgi:hypothetical protein